LIYAIGSIVDSPLLTALTLFVTVGSIAGQFLVVELLQ